MTLKSIPYKWTYLVGVALLGSLLWSCTFRDGLLDFLVIFLFFCFLVSVIVSLVLAVASRTRDAFYRIAINLIVADGVEITSTKRNITVRYFDRDSNALAHSGYMYRSDDDPTELGKEYPKTGYTRVAPHWFYFSE